MTTPIRPVPGKVVPDPVLASIAAHPGDTLREQLKLSGLTQTEAAKALGFSTSLLSQIIARGECSAAAAEAIETFTGGLFPASRWPKKRLRTNAALARAWLAPEAADLLRAELRDVTAERDALRARASLPVIAMCGDCRWYRPSNSRLVADQCAHDAWPYLRDRRLPRLGPSGAPPDECPLRKAGTFATEAGR